MTKARDVIDPHVMTQIFTKAKEMGKLTASEIKDNSSKLTTFYLYYYFICYFQICPGRTPKMVSA